MSDKPHDVKSKKKKIKRTKKIKLGDDEGIKVDADTPKLGPEAFEIQRQYGGDYYYHKYLKYKTKYINLKN